MTKHIVATGFVVGLPEGFEFDVNKPYTCCLLCGAVYQGGLDLRVPSGHEPENSIIAKLAKNGRDDWAVKHAKTHSQKEHHQLRLSGRMYTPEAAQRLTSIGVISLTDLVMDDEVRDALAKAPRITDKEVEH